jgi:Kef-type K+ transport system membrane component KefB
VQYYIWYNLGIITLTIVISIVMLFYHNPVMISLMNKQVAEGHQTLFVCICTCISIVFIATIIGLFWLFYKLLYGILLKKLFANYKELEKIEL